MKGLLLALVSLAVAPALPAAAQAPDHAMVAAIREEGLQRSQVMELAGWLSDVYGPRVTGSPAIEAAGEWAMRQLRAWGVADVHAERFAFGQGWSLEQFHAQMVAPQVMPIIGYPKSWTSSTDVRVDIRSRADLDRYRGTLRGAIVLPQPVREVRMLEGDLVLRMDRTLLAEARRPLPLARTRGSPRAPRLPTHVVEQFYLDEGVVAVLDRGSDYFMVGGAPSGSRLRWPTQRVDGGTVFVGSGGPWDDDAGRVVPAATIAVEHYNRMVRILERGLPVRVQINIRTRFHPEGERLNGFNILGEIPGTDLRDEVVMLGAHFDSTHAATGATDNASGTAAMMEALRILRAVGAAPRRTIRIALWGAEEQGLLGSREYVRRHAGAQARLRQAVGLLQPRQRGRMHSGRMAAGQPRGRRDLRALAGAAGGPGRRGARPARHARHGPRGVRRGGPAGLSVHAGPARVQLADAPLEHGLLRPAAAGRPGADGRGGRGLRLQHGDARRPAAAQGPAGVAPVAGRRSLREAGLRATVEGLRRRYQMRKMLALLSVAVLVPLVACVEDPVPEAEVAPAAEETPAAAAELPILPLDQVQASQSGSVSQTVANTEITVTYDRPVARGRELYGGIVAYGQIWNPGANDATAIAFSRPVTVNGQPLEAGKYSIWAIPDPDEWTLIFSRAADVYHQPYPGEEHDALRLNVAPASGDHMETLAFYFSVVERKDAELRLHWGTTIVPLSITVP